MASKRAIFSSDPRSSPCLVLILLVSMRMALVRSRSSGFEIRSAARCAP
jgi:hypothetical protein